MATYLPEHKQVAPAYTGWHLGLTLVLTWSFQFLAVLLQDTLPQAILIPLTYLGSLSVFLVAVCLVQYRHDRAFQQDYWQRIINFRRIPGRWLAVILLLEPVVTVAAALSDWLLGGIGMRSEALSGLIKQPLLILPTLLWWMLFGPLIEEPGWRGYALDGLLARYSAVISSAVVGAAWALWHVPLTLLHGTWQAQHHPFGSPQFLFYIASLFVGSFLYTWIYTNTNRSTLAVILFHFVTNAFGELFEISLRTDLIKFGIFCLLVIVILLTHSRNNTWFTVPGGSPSATAS